MKNFHVGIDEAIDFKELDTYGKLFEMARLKVHHDGLSSLDEKEFKEFIARLAAYCCDMGIPEEMRHYYHDGFDTASKNAERMMLATD